jgi:hypothetical protein
MIYKFEKVLGRVDGLKRLQQEMSSLFVCNGRYLLLGGRTNFPCTCRGVAYLEETFCCVLE